MSEIKLKQLCKRYENNDKLVVDHIDLVIEDNEFLVLVGPSGCGKSTTLRMIAGLEEITDGEILIDGKVVNSLLPKDRNVSMVFQNYALYPHLNVHGNLAFGLRHQSGPKVPKEEINRRVMSIAEMLELKELLKRRPAQLSGGQRQRVALGRAMVRETGVLLMDEPLSNLDAKLRVQMRSEILNLHQKIKRTVVYVTHDQIEAMTMGDRIAVMNGGIIQQCDKPQMVYSNPANLFVAGFLGSSPMNFLPVQIKKAAAGYVAACLQFKIPLDQNRFGSRLAAYEGKQMVAGVRPEHVCCGNNGELEGRISIIEKIGAEYLITANLGGIEFESKAKSVKGMNVGTMISFSIPQRSLYLFDQDSGENVLYDSKVNSKI